MSGLLEFSHAVYCRYGLMPCPICLGDPQDPVTLPCDHVFCQNCIKQWLAPGQMICPYCRVNLPDAYNVTVSKELRYFICPIKTSVVPPVSTDT